MVHTPDQNTSSTIIKTVLRSVVVAVTTENTFTLHFIAFVYYCQNLINNATDFSLFLASICQTSES
jgi:hypothetical protein